jgi:ribose-phosphate pyrophosphokinase
MYLLSTTSNEKFAEEIARHLGVELVERVIGRFHNGEVRIQNIKKSMRAQDVYIIYSSGSNINDELAEVKFLIRACKQASAKSVTLIIPFLPYARQDKKLQGREPISVKCIIDEIEVAGATKMMTVDIHNPAIQGMTSRCTFDNLTCVPLFAEYITTNMLTPHITMGGDKHDFVVISPDAGGTERAKNLANRLGLKMAVMYKSRPAPGEISSMELLGDVKGKIAIIIDDMADTCGTLKKATEELAKKVGLKDGQPLPMYSVITHGVFSHNPTNDDLTRTTPPENSALKNITDSELTTLFVTNSINLYDKNVKCDKITCISIASLVACAILRYHKKQSISEMLDMTSNEIDTELEHFRMFPQLSPEEELHKIMKMNNTLVAQVATLDAQVSRLSRNHDPNNYNKLNVIARSSSVNDIKGTDVFEATC